MPSPRDTTRSTCLGGATAGDELLNQIGDNIIFSVFGNRWVRKELIHNFRGQIGVSTFRKSHLRRRNFSHTIPLIDSTYICQLLHYAIERTILLVRVNGSTVHVAQGIMPGHAKHLELRIATTRIADDMNLRFSGLMFRRRGGDNAWCILVWRNLCRIIRGLSGKTNREALVD